MRCPHTGHFGFDIFICQLQPYQRKAGVALNRPTYISFAIGGVKHTSPCLRGWKSLMSSSGFGARSLVNPYLLIHHCCFYSYICFCDKVEIDFAQINSIHIFVEPHII